MSIKLSRKEDEVFSSDIKQVRLPIKIGVGSVKEYDWNSDWKEGENLLMLPLRNNVNINKKYFNMETGLDFRLIIETTDDKYILVVKIKHSHGTDYVTVNNTNIDPIRIRKTISLKDFNRKKALEKYDL